MLFVRHPAHLWAALSRDAPLAKVAARVELLEAAYVAAARGEAFDQIVVYEDVARDPEKLLAALLKLGYVEQDASAAAATAPACCRRYCFSSSCCCVWWYARHYYNYYNYYYKLTPRLPQVRPATHLGHDAVQTGG